MLFIHFFAFGPEPGLFLSNRWNVNDMRDLITTDGKKMANAISFHCFCFSPSGISWHEIWINHIVAWFLVFLCQIWPFRITLFFQDTPRVISLQNMPKILPYLPLGSRHRFSHTNHLGINKMTWAEFTVWMVIRHNATFYQLATMVDCDISTSAIVRVTMFSLWVSSLGLGVHVAHYRQSLVMWLEESLLSNAYS